MLYRDSFYKIPPLHSIQKYFNNKLENIIFDVFENDAFKQKFSEELPDFNLNGLKNSILLDSDTE